MSVVVISNKDFDEYIEKREIEKLGYLKDTLADLYSKNSGWNAVADNYDLWWELQKKGWLEHAFNQYDQDEMTFGDRTIVSVIYQQFDGSVPPVWDPMNLGPRVCLFNDNKEYIAGQKKFSSEECMLLPIDFSGRTIGWLGLKKNPKKIYQPIDQTLRANKSILFYTVGVVFILFILSVAFLVNKYIVRPVTRLAAATKKLGYRDFNTRIAVKSSDEIGELAANFNEMAQRLQDYEYKQKQWLSDISHELRTPLSVLRCQIDALNDGIRKPNKVLLMSLGNEISHLIKLVNDINDISLIETGAFNVKKEPVIPFVILSQEVNIFRERFESNKMSIKFDVEPDVLDQQIIGDAGRIKQLFSNILENAVRHVKKPGRLTIRQTCNKEKIKFLFIDSGPGVPDDALNLLFNRLYRVDSSRSRKTGGNGLGLSICKSIVEMHNGEIRAQNTPENGFLIEITLPPGNMETI